MNELRNVAMARVGTAQKKRKKAHDQKTQPYPFGCGDLVLQRRRLKRSLESYWIGPYRVIQRIGDCGFLLKALFPGAEGNKYKVHGRFLKKFHDNIVFPSSLDCIFQNDTPNVANDSDEEPPRPYVERNVDNIQMDSDIFKVSLLSSVSHSAYTEIQKIDCEGLVSRPDTQRESRSCIMLPFPQSTDKKDSQNVNWREPPTVLSSEASSCSIGQPSTSDNDYHDTVSSSSDTDSSSDNDSDSDSDVGNDHEVSEIRADNTIITPLPSPHNARPSPINPADTSANADRTENRIDDRVASSHATTPSSHANRTEVHIYDHVASSSATTSSSESVHSRPESSGYDTVHSQDPTSHSLSDNNGNRSDNNGQNSHDNGRDNSHTQPSSYTSSSSGPDKNRQREMVGNYHVEFIAVREPCVESSSSQNSEHETRSCSITRGVQPKAAGECPVIAENVHSGIAHFNIPIEHVQSSPDFSSSAPSEPFQNSNISNFSHSQISHNVSVQQYAPENTDSSIPFQNLDVSGLLSHSINPTVHVQNSSTTSTPHEHPAAEHFQHEQALLTHPIMHNIGLSSAPGMISGLQNVVLSTSMPGRSHSTTATPAHSDDEDCSAVKNDEHGNERNLISFTSTSESSELTPSTVRSNTVAATTIAIGHENSNVPDNLNGNDNNSGHVYGCKITMTGNNEVFADPGPPAAQTLVRKPLFSYPFPSTSTGNFSPAVFNYRNPNMSLPSFSDSFGAASPVFQSTPRSTSNSIAQSRPTQMGPGDGTFTVFPSPSSADPNRTIPCPNCVLKTCEIHSHLPESSTSAQSPAPPALHTEAQSSSNAINASLLQPHVQNDAQPVPTIPTSPDTISDGQPTRQRQPPSRLQYSPSYLTRRGRGRGIASSRAKSSTSSRGKRKKGQ